jgi:hypothetical protein
MFIINNFQCMVFVFSISLTWNPHGLLTFGRSHMQLTYLLG